MPDVLILPSKLNTFAKDYKGSVVINPGHLTKGKGGGSFLELAIAPSQNGRDEMISDCVFATIKKI
jgi:hypothetical protein